MCQRVVIHTSQNAKGPKVIEFKTIENDNQSTQAAKPARKPRVASAKPPLSKDENNRPIKAQNVPKWKQESEQVRRALGRSKVDSTNQYNMTGSTVNSQQKRNLDTRRQCPHCSRMFSDDAAQRHFPICERNSQSSKLMVVRDNSKTKGQV